MNPATEKLLEDTRQRLFESDDFRVNRELVQWVQPNTGDPDDLDTLLDRIDRFAPAMQQWANSFNGPQTQVSEQ
jgi:hypothetical protein